MKFDLIGLGQDILARVKDDAGAFLISCIEMIDTDLDAIQALIIVPTRELATQIGKLCAELSKHLNVKVCFTMVLVC